MLKLFIILHFLLPLLITIFIIFHIYFLHIESSAISLSHQNSLFFSKFLILKDLVTLIIIFTLLLRGRKYLGIDCENFSESNPMFSPSHIKPE